MHQSLSHVIAFFLALEKLIIQVQIISPFASMLKLHGITLMSLCYWFSIRPSHFCLPGCNLFRFLPILHWKEKLANLLIL
jgi:hypothetical protein